MKTYTRKVYEASRDAWAWGEYGPEWEPYRKAAALRGFIFPPPGTPEDNREDENPSQRAIVWAAICDTPDALLTIIRRSDSWSHVVGQVIGDMASRREDADIGEKDAAWARRGEPSRREAAEAVGAILGRLVKPS